MAALLTFSLAYAWRARPLPLPPEAKFVLVAAVGVDRGGQVPTQLTAIGAAPRLGL